MTYPKADDASKWKWWYLQRVYDRALRETNIADLTSYFGDVDQLLVPVQLIDPMCRRRIQELNDEGLIDGHIGDVALTDAGRMYVEHRRAPWPTKARRMVVRLLGRPSVSGAIAAIVVVLLTASGAPWWWPSDKPQLPQQEVIDDTADDETSTRSLGRA